MTERLTPFQAKVLKALGDDELTPYEVELRLAGPRPTTGRFLWLRQLFWMTPPLARAVSALWDLERAGLVTSREDAEYPGRRLYRRAGDTNPR